MAIQAHWIRASILFSILSLLFLVGFGAQPASAASRPAAAPLADACFVSLNNSGVTDHSSADASALQSAVSAANSGDTLKVAGTCAGVATVSGKLQTVYVSKNLTIVGGYAPGAWSAQPDSEANPTVLDAQSSGRVAIIDNSASVAMRHLTLRNGLVGGTQFGGAILVNAGSELLLGQSRIEESEANVGGAIFQFGPVEIEQSTLSNNRSTAGGAIYIASSGLVATPLTVTASTFVSNTSTYDGGAIYSDGTLDITNSTFSGNSAGGAGGAIVANVPSPFTTAIRYSTFSDNRAASGGGIYGSATATLFASIVANSTGGDCANGVVDGGYNLIEDGSCIGQASSISGDPALLPLADNGGPTQTHTFIYGSLARNRIPQGDLECGLGIGADQRDEIRPTGVACDVGATEYVPAQPVAIDDNGATDEETALSVPVPGVLANDSDPNGDPLTVQLISGPSSGDISLHADGAYVYTPTLNFNGADSFVYRIFDGNLSDSATVTIQVSPLNDPPMAIPDQRYAASAGESIIDVLRNDIDVDGDTLTLLSVSDPPKGTAVVSGNQVRYTPDPGPVGSVDTFTYTMTDGQEEASAQVTVTTFQADFSGACTTADDLIAAINNANLDPEPDTITLAAGCTYTLTAYAIFNPDGYGPVGLPPIDSDITIQGNGAVIERAVDAQNTFRLFYVRENSALTLQQVHLRGGAAQGGNGSRSAGIGEGVEGRGGRGGGAAGLGGAIFNRGAVTILESTLSDNQAIGGNSNGVIGGGRHQGGGGGGMAASATNRNGGAGGGGNGGTSTNGSNGGFGGGGGGGGYNGSNGRNGGNGGFGGGGGGRSSHDGGIAGSAGSSGYGGGNGVTVRAGGGAGMGGAIFNWHGSVSLVNSTLAGNRAQGGVGAQGGRGLGGALFNGAGTVEIIHSTLAGNIVQGRNPEGGSVFNYQPDGQNAGIITLRNSILADSSGGNDCGNDGGTVTAPAPNYNLIEVGGACAAPATTADPALSPLADNGGGTPTMAITSGSPAKDAVPAGDCLAATDQRGAARPQQAGCEVGAYEFVNKYLALTAEAPGLGVNATTPLHARLFPPLAGVTVEFAMIDGGGGLSQLSAVTDGSGTATVNYMADNSVGVARIQATITDLALTDDTFVYVAAATGATRQERSTGNQHSIGHLGDYSIVAEQSGDGTPWLGVARYAANPCPNSTQAVTPAGDYVDLLLEGTGGVNSLTVTVAYSDTIGSPSLYWCDVNGEWQATTVGTVDTDNKTITLAVTDATSPSLSDLEGTPLVVGSNAPLAVSLGWFLAEQDGDSVDFRWQTASETGTAGFHVLAATGENSDSDKLRLNPELIPSPVIDSVEPTNYAFSAITEATRFCLQEIGIDGSVSEHGPFELGVASGVEIGAESGVESGTDVEMTPVLWLPIVSSETASTDGRSAIIQEEADRPEQMADEDPEVTEAALSNSAVDQGTADHAGLLPKLWLPLVQR